MGAVDLARWQFGITTVYHFLFVPLSIGLSAIVAGLQTAWFVTRARRYLTLTKFFGKIFIINFAVGIVTGLIQEFQFGMNWSAYSRFVGDIFGVPLAIEGLLAFFLESTFLGLWVFGWDRLPRVVHLGCIWLVAIGTQISAYVILSVNAWMQHPVGYRIDPATGRAELTDFTALLTNPVAIEAGLHTAAACLLTGGALVAGVAFWHLARSHATEAARVAFRTAAKVGSGVVVVAALGVVVTGDLMMKLMTQLQPMKVAAAEGLFDTEQPAGFSLLTLGTADGRRELWSFRFPDLLSFLATGSFTGKVEGVNQLQEKAVAAFGPGDYVPNVPVTYWSFRLMIGFGLLAAFLALVGLLVLRKPGLLANRWVPRVALTVPFLPLLANSFGWLFTEGGRQPWLAYGLFQTADGASPGTAAWQVAVSLAAFTVVYGVLAVVELGLLRRVARQVPDLPPDDGDDAEPAPPGRDPGDRADRDADGADRPITFAY
ncbi:cytochrome ubiquinol oxidase subunit I [Actinopolymorpha rutila]|uniref:Cytochrome d ubiquinol oxidase subunit I n=1 Tax=Actinopolymorpha rutila TaxID=446787 RepID=A0A852ZLP6_9ACTN|nr:cytochrome ubiquinol oxidase subunit I [Actinopolymorpha rutila]NYH89346.1 cytochrome d ubiquinol oxidase subunit I [Actinopolymorpha rutila]